MARLMIKSGNRYRAATVSEVCEVASSYLFNSAIGKSVKSPQETKDFLRMQGAMEFEQFGIIYVDKRHRVISVEILFNGTIDGASVYPREVVKAALRENAAAVILFHNHPSGIAEQSSADEIITERLKSALALIDVRLLDHMIVTRNSVLSFAERGLI